MPDEPDPSATVGEASPLGRDAASTEVSPVEPISSGYVASVADVEEYGYDAPEVKDTLIWSRSEVLDNDGETVEATVTT